jgi:hypothetical protein
VAEHEATAPQFSVILPLVRGRTVAHECLQAWLCRQTFARASYEVVLVSNGSEPELEAWVAPYLRPQDRLLHCDSREEFEIFHHGACQARGRYLAFSELHCVPADDYLNALDRFFAQTGHRGARGRSANGAEDPPLLERLEAMKFARDFMVQGEAAKWLKVLMHSFTIERDVYFEAGGFEYRYSAFAEWALAAKLDTMGVDVAYCEDATVFHHYGAQFSLVRRYIEDFAKGELAYRAEHDPAYCSRYFGPTPATSRGPLPPQAKDRLLARVLGRSLLADLRRGDATQAVTWAGRLAGLLPNALLGVPKELLRARAEQQAALARTMFWRFDFSRCYRAYLDYWEATNRLVHLQTEPGYNQAPPVWPQALAYELPCLDEARLTGFYEIESLYGQDFRWSGPLASVRIAVAPGDYEVELSVLDLRPWTVPQRLQVYLGETRLECTAFDFGRGYARFRAPRSLFSQPDDQYDLILVTNEYRARDYGAIDDKRDLGIPLRAVHFRPLPGQA